MEEIIYKVYVLLDINKCITDVWSTGNQCLGDKRTEEEMIGQGYVLIDEGSDGDIYGYAQINYLEKKYGRPTYDEQMHPNYRLVGTTPTVLSDEEKQTLFPPSSSQPTEQDLINADLYMQIAQLQMNGISIMSLSNSPRYELLKKYYDMGIYNDENMKLFVACGWITSDEYKEITGSIYVANML